MDTDCFSRRNLLEGGTALIASPLLSAQTSGAVLTAGEVIDRIKKNVGIPWRERTEDNIIAGSPDTPVSGIATTMMATRHLRVGGTSASFRASRCWRGPIPMW